jgi:hypothetical protein
VAKVAELPQDLEDPFPGPKLGDGGSIHDSPSQKASGSVGVDAGLTCTNFGWTSVWKTLISSKTHGGRVPEAYLKAHLEESDEIHVIIGG